MTRPGSLSLAAWLGLIGMMTLIGVARVAQETAIYLKSYEIGARVAKLHELTGRTRWLETQVMGLQAPDHLAHVMKHRKLELVAWSTADVSQDAHVLAQQLGE